MSSRASSLGRRARAAPRAVGRAGPATGALGRPARGVRAARAAGEAEAAAAAGGEAEEAEAASDESWAELEELKRDRAARSGCYATKLAAVDAPEWHAAPVLRLEQLSAGARNVRNVVLSCEASRELVPLAKAYTAVGQRAQVKVAGREAVAVPPASAPFSSFGPQEEVLWQLKKDLFAHEVKAEVEPTSLRAELHLYADEETHPDVYALAAGDEVEVGPFLGHGTDFLRGNLQHMYAYPLVVLLAEGDGIAAARALIEARSGLGGLCLNVRDEVRLFYRVRNREEACYADRFAEGWGNVKVTVHTDSFLEAWDADDELEYEPDMTAVLAFGDAATEEAAAELCEEAEIPMLVRGSDEARPFTFLDSTLQV